MKLGSLLVLLVTCSLLLVISDNAAHGFIEIKKYKVINSPDVCGEKLCSPLNEQKAKKGLSTRDIKICGDRPCNAKSETSDKLTYKKGPDSALNINLFRMNEQSFLLFTGKGWHNLHNVEMKITGQAFETSIRSKTDDQGNLYMPWPIPKTFADGTYRIFATDSIRSVEVSAEITVNGAVSISAGKPNKCSSTKTPIDWSGCDLYGKVLTNIDLRMAKLKNANLFGASLQNKDLSGADLSHAILKNANLDGADLTGADLSHSSMIDAKVRNANLSDAKFSYAKLYRTDFTKSDLSDADFTGATLSDANLSFANLKGANLEHAGTWATNLNQCKNHPICEK
ncbi:MAG: pentapeptide repeat-containing protein [Nitrososphaerota archaeon]